MSKRALRLAACALVTAGGAGAVFVATEDPAYAGVSASVQVATSLSMRTGPGRDYRLLGTLRNGTKVTVACRLVGEYIIGNTRTNQWDVLSGGQHVSHAYLNASAPIPLCATGRATTTPAGPVRVAASVRVDTSLAMRTGPGRNYRLLGTLGNGAKVTVTCRATGEYIRGNTGTDQWAVLTGGQYVSQAFLTAGGTIPTCSTVKTTTTPDRSTTTPEPNGSMTTSQFIAAAAVPAQQTQREYRVPASVTIAQAIVESGWGRSQIATDDKNFFGIKCFDRGPIALGCHTYQSGESYRRYASVLDSFRDHARLLADGPRYAAAFAHAQDPNRFAAEIQRAGYATNPAYASDLTSVMTTYHLYDYDLH